MRLALAQLDTKSYDLDSNISRCASFAKSAARLGADLLVLPEVFSTGFFFFEGAEAREAGEKSELALKTMAKENGIAVCGSFASAKEEGEKPLNLFQLWTPEGKLCEYAKLHLFSFAGEDKRYQTGSTLVSCSLLGINICPLICYDLRFDYCFSSIADSIDLFIIPANWPAERHQHWEILLQARAIDSQAYIAGVNRVGRGGKLSYEGGSMLVSPRGEILVQGAGAEGLLIGEVDAQEVRSWREEFPSLVDRKNGVQVLNLKK